MSRVEIKYVGRVSETADGFCPELPGGNTKYLRGDGTWAAVPAGVTTLANLADVSLTSLSDGDMLQYNASSKKWINGGVIKMDGPF